MTKQPFPIRQIAEERGLRLYREPLYAEATRSEKEWFLELRGKGGILYGHDATHFWVDTTSGRATKFTAIPHVKAKISPDGREARILYNIKRLDAVLDVLQPRKRKQLTPEQRAAIGERLRAARNPIIEEAKPAQISTISHKDGV